ncbi:restriction endonuclease subunit S [Paenibacillus amylolyticus]|uniref:restriction endonuclease subunit S n=1 Tax=Paenibacillus amylolyticus TaxID=1451 RepID=UPI003D98351B
MSEQKENVPKLRFPGFSGAWEKRRLGDLCDVFQSGKNIKSEEIKDKGSYPVFGGNGLRGYTNTYNHNGLYALIGRQGALCGNMNISQGKAYFTEHAIAVKGNHNNDTRFLYYLLGKMNLGQYSGQSAQPGLAVNKLIALTATIPSFREQAQIGIFFEKLDLLISGHQSKLNNVKNLKAGMLQKMFPKNGEDVPEIRFPGFSNAWEKRKLGEVTKSYSGGTPSVGNYDYYDGDIPFIRSAEINSESTELSISETGLNNSSAKIVEMGVILYALYGATSGEVSISKVSGAINQAILAILPDEGYDAQFIMQWLRKQKQKIIDKYLQGGQGNLSGSIVKDLQIEFPIYDEQRKIGIFFTHLDTLISLHQRKLEHLQQQKSALLQQMFV